MNTELEEFKNFKKTYNFKQKEIEIVDGIEYCMGEPIFNEEGRRIGECDKWINVGYENKGQAAKILSNLFNYEFEFKGKKLSSIESFFQGIKFKDVQMQNEVFKYSGLDSNRIKVCSDYNWKETGIVYWQGHQVDRFSAEYDDLIDELYVSAIKNVLYRNALKICNKEILHTIGTVGKENTVFTRYEFERELNCLKDFLKGSRI